MSAASGSTAGRMSGDYIQLNIVGVQGKKTPLVIEKNRKMGDLFQQTSSKCGLNVPAEDIRLIYQGEELEHNSDKSIQDCGLQNNGHVYMVVRVKGGKMIY